MEIVARLTASHIAGSVIEAAYNHALVIGSYQFMSSAVEPIMRTPTIFAFAYAGKLTKWPWGILAGTVALSMFRPYVQQSVDKSCLGETYSEYIFNLIPVFTIGLAQWMANHSIKNAVYTGMYFGLGHKLINQSQHNEAWMHVWGIKFIWGISNTRLKKNRDPRNYYEEIALKQGRAKNERQQLQEIQEDAAFVRALCLIGVGKEEEGISLYQKHQNRHCEYAFLPHHLLRAQLSFYVTKKDCAQLHKTIDDCQQSLKAKRSYDQFSCYEVMIQAYRQMNATTSLLTLLQQMEEKLPEIENEHAHNFGYDHSHRVMIALGYCSLSDQDQKIIKLMTDQRYQQCRQYRKNISKFFDMYFGEKCVKNNFDLKLLTKLKIPIQYYESINEEFNTRIALAYIKISHPLAKNFAEKVTGEAHLRQLIEAYIKSAHPSQPVSAITAHLRQAQNVAKKTTDRSVYKLIAQAFLNQAFYTEAIKMAKKTRNADFQAFVYWDAYAKAKLHEKELETILDPNSNNPSVSLSIKAKVLHSLGRGFEMIEQAPETAEKVKAYLVLAELTQETNYLEKAEQLVPKMVEKGEDFPIIAIAKAYLNNHQIDKAFHLARQTRQYHFSRFVIDCLEIKAAQPYFFQKLARVQEYRLRLELAQALQQKGDYQKALEMLNVPMDL